MFFRDLPTTIELGLRPLREDLIAMRQREVRLETENQLLKQQLAIAQNNFEWARERMNQLEHERGALFMRVLNMDMPIARVERATTPPVGTGRPISDPANDMAQQFGVSFEDVGDQMAAQLGLEHDEQGSLTFRK